MWPRRKGRLSLNGRTRPAKRVYTTSCSWRLAPISEGLINHCTGGSRITCQASIFPLSSFTPVWRLRQACLFLRPLSLPSNWEIVHSCPGAPGAWGWSGSCCCGWPWTPEGHRRWLRWPGGLLPGLVFIFHPPSLPLFVSKWLGEVSVANFVTCLFLLEFWRWTLCMHEYIFGLWKGTCWKTFSKNWTECIHAPEKTRARGETHAGRTGLDIFPVTLSSCALLLQGLLCPRDFWCPLMMGNKNVAIDRNS